MQLSRRTDQPARYLLRILILTLILALGATVSERTATVIAATEVAAINGTIPDPTTYKHIATIPPLGQPSGVYSGEFSSSDHPNTAVDPAMLPNRPFIGTELYYLEEHDSGLERKWLTELEFDFLRVLIDPEQVGMGLPADGSPNTDFTNWTLHDFESGQHGWKFNDPEFATTTIMNSIGEVVEFPLMLINHRGGESYMGNPPNSDQYTEYFLATVYYYNVVRGMNIKYWEVLNEPDWGWSKVKCDAACYATIFKRVAERIKNHPDPRVNSIRLGGPTLGSGDPIDGSWPDAYPNRTSDGERGWRDYIPTLLAQGSRDQQHDIGFLSWHDYGDTWGLPANMYNLNQNYVVINRVNAFDALLDEYTAAAGERPPLVVSEMNFDAGVTKDQGQFRYKNFYGALWHTSTLNNYFSTGKVSLISHFFWRGTNDFPKGLVFNGNDSGGGIVRNPSWYAYKEYITHTQNKILTASNSRVDRWADAIVTTDENGKMIYLIAVNKSDQPRVLDFSFDAPSSLLGPVAISKQTMQKDGNEMYGSWFRKPQIVQPYQFQAVTFAADKQIRYQETILPMTIVYYTVVRMES
jgi:hypothetical protein